MHCKLGVPCSFIENLSAKYIAVLPAEPGFGATCVCRFAGIDMSEVYDLGQTDSVDIIVQPSRIDCAEFISLLSTVVSIVLETDVVAHLCMRKAQPRSMVHYGYPYVHTLSTCRLPKAYAVMRNPCLLRAVGCGLEATLSRLLRIRSLEFGIRTCMRHWTRMG